MSGGGEEDASLEFTPTWIIAIVCTVIIFSSLFFERFLHYVGKVLKRKQNFVLFEALLKVQEELMLLGFISLMLSVFQGSLQRTCIKESLMLRGLPCKRKSSNSVSHVSLVQHYQTNFPLHFTGMRMLLASESGGSGHCKNGEVPLLPVEATHQLHIFIFVLAMTHVILSLITIVLGIAQMRDWKSWEARIQQEDDTAEKMVKHVHDQLQFIKKRFKENKILSWLHSFGKQFYGTITIDDYRAMRLGFIMMHYKDNPKFNFYKYMIRALETDFKKVVGISWYFWALVIIFLLVNVNGWHAYFWISFVPFILLFILGAKLEHIISNLAKKVVDQNVAIVGGKCIVIPSDDLFWFKSPGLVIFFIHYILFQNAFDIAYFFWILTTFNFDSCIMGNKVYIIPRLVFSGIIQVVCGYSTLPLYAIVSHMGSRYKKAILPDHMHDTFEQWLASAKSNKLKREENSNGLQVQNPTNEGTGYKLWGAWNRNKASNKTEVVAKSGEEMQEIQQEPVPEIEIGIHN